MIRYWRISHGADCTETGHMQYRTYIKTTWTGFPAHRDYEQQILNDWCRERFGREVEYVQGIAPTLNWWIGTSTEDCFSQATPETWAGRDTPTRRVELEIGKHGETKVVSDVDATIQP